MVYRIAQMKVSRFRTDYNNHFEIWSKMRNGKIGNQDLANEKIEGLFTVIDSVVLLLPRDANHVDSDIIDHVNSKSENSRIKDNYTAIFDDLVFHAIELHKNDKACHVGENMHFYNFNDYSEINDFIDSIDDANVEVLIYTTLVNSDVKEEPNVVHNDNRKYIDKRTTTTTHVEGNFNKVNANSTVKKGKGFWSKLVGFILRMFGAS